MKQKDRTTAADHHVFILYFKDRIEVLLVTGKNSPKIGELNRLVENPDTRPLGAVEAQVIMAAGKDNGDGIITEIRRLYDKEEKKNLVGDIDKMWPQ